MQPDAFELLCARSERPTGCQAAEKRVMNSRRRLRQTSSLEKGRAAGHIRWMRTRLPILLSVALLAAAILLVFRDELHAHSEPVTLCGFWGSIEAGMSCR
jgi:hypothetical protein